MDVLALVLGVVLASGGSYAEARYVSRRWRQRVLPAFGPPNIHNWNWLPNVVPLRTLLLRVGGMVAGVVLIGAAVGRRWPPGGGPAC